MRYLSVCSGMEAASVAWHPLGWQPVGFSEIEPFPCAILKHRFPNTPNYGSLTEHQSWPIEQGAIDLLVGGTPCQSFSVAGLRKGLEDPRGNLALVFLGLADRIKPRWIVWENVPGVLSSNGGRDLGSFLGALVQLGYGFAFRILDAQHFGVPQRRRRVFVVACLGDWRAPAEVLLEPDCVRRDTKKGRAKGQGPAAGAEGGVDANGLQRTVGTLCADTHPGAYSGQDAYTGRLIPQEKPIAFKVRGVGNYSGTTGAQSAAIPSIQMQPFSVAFGAAKLENTAPTIMANGGPNRHGEGSWSATQFTGVIQPAIPFRKSKRAQSTTDDESWVPADASNTLNNFDLGDTRTTHAVVEPKVYENHAQDSRVNGPLDVAPTVAAKFGTGGGNVPFVNNEPIAFDTYNQAVSNTNQAIGSSASDVNHYGAIFNPPMAVRRLTPVECERLQGFPDNWSRIPWKGKPETECPDGPRYKACGNSMAVPVMRWIGERIAAVESSSHA